MVAAIALKNPLRPSSFWTVRGFCIRPLSCWTRAWRADMDWSCDQLGERERYRLLVNTVLPRPIALVTTCDQQGRVNTAPFSFFNVMGSEPAVLALGLENDAHS